MASVKNILPNCGLYRTTKPLPEHESEIPAGVLVYFHNHSDSGLPVVIAPDHNIMNRWHFHGAGIPFRGLSWAESLARMPNEGFYFLRKDLTFDGGSWPKGTLVQLGYTRNGDPILFIAQQRANLEENDLFFSDRGVGIRPEVLANLEPLKVYEEPIEEGGHSSGTQSH
ncbi:hypothetical protein LVJ94_36900 [Pendulispora rubella]|uniref:Uncharacterized protein n=1 Tax=Pendulispora rubella TaxID=2741070 RepID=A0ABZ2KUX9_9BACT